MRLFKSIFAYLGLAPFVCVLGNASSSTPSNFLNRTSSSLQVYPIPSGVATTTSFSVKVRSSNNASWIPVDTYLVTLNLINTTSGGSLIQDSSMVYFDFDGCVDISVTYNTATIDTAVIRPYSYGLTPAIVGNTLTFTLTEPRNLVIQVNDNIFDCLHLFSNAIEKDVPNSNDTDIIYFGPGLHKLASGELAVPSGKTVYVAGGAVLTFGLNFTDVQDAGVKGHGVLYKTPSGAITVQYASNITIEGVTALDPGGYSVTAGEVDGLIIRGMRSFSSKGNGDGIDLFSCKNSVIDQVFMRNSDDCIALYNHRWDYYGNSTNITVSNSSLWADVAHPINIGTHGNTDDPETLDGITITNIDILDHREPQMLYQGCIAINPGDSNMVQNVHIEDVRVEDFRIGQLINMRVMFNTKYNTSPGRGIANVTVKNMTYNGTHANPSILDAYDEERNINGVTFENLVINGKLISDSMEKPAWYLASDFIPMFANDNVKNLFFNRT